ncbi:FtsK-like protein [Bacillus thuringiensis]|uniref:FtsK-like protein n=1 Tax=Bacillus thuringiensis TaxID=1428 RepID=A0A4R4B4C5_BACTU|nr:FtsK-like protein [Bacillus thuringiensis]TCW47623.1 FtsK-like protein [Bacillus thuringiensis]
MFTLLGSFRNKMIFGDVTPYDAKIFSDMFGEKEEFKEAESEQGISPMQENPVSRLGSTYQKTKEVVMSPGDIMAQGAFICAARIVQDNHVQPVQQITSNFVPKEEFVQAVIQVDMEIGRYWENERLRLIDESIAKANPIKHVDAENIKKIQSFPPMQEDAPEQNSSKETNGEQQHIVSLEDYKEHKSQNETPPSNSAVINQQIEADEEETENMLYEEIKAFIIESQQVSPSLLQRKFRIGYIKAMQFIEKLEQNLVVSSFTGDGPRKVFISNDTSGPKLSEDLDINTTYSSDTNSKNTISQEVSIPGEDKGSVQEETSSFKDILYDDVVAFVKQAETASIPLLQDTFKISSTRASRLIDALQRTGEMPIAEEDIEEVINIELPHMMEESHEINMEVADLNEELSTTMLEQDWNKDFIILSGISNETEPLQEEFPADGLPISITGDAETNLESTSIPVTIEESVETPVEINAITISDMVNHTGENRLDEEVAKVYESISLTVHQNLEKDMKKRTGIYEEQHEYKPMSYKERQERLKAQQQNNNNNNNNNMQLPLNKIEKPKQKTPNVMSKELDNLFD